MGLMTDAAVVNIEGNTKQLVDQINKADKAMQNFDSTLTDILTHLTEVEKGLKNVNSITNNASKITNSVQTRYNRETYDFGKQAKIVKSSAGFMSSSTGREKAFRDYQQAVINETKEITADIAERKRLRKQRADAETTTANAARIRALKQEDQASARYLDRMDKLAEARLLNAKNNQAGAFYRDPRYQTGKAFSAVGDVVSTWGTGGRVAGLLLDSLGAFVKSPVAGTATAVSNLVKGVSELGKASTQAFAEIEAIKTQLGVVFSNQTQADSMFGQISQYAVKSPFGVQQTSELAVLLKQSGVYASDLMDTLRMLGDTAGGNMEKMKRIANNYAQIVSIGKASMLDMRQFAYAGIPIFEAVSKELGVSQQELRKLISDGKVTSDIIEKVFKDLTGINGIFENATEKGAKTLKARLQNLADAKQLAFGSIGEWGVNLGTQTGNDSIVNSLVTTAEGIYQYIKDHVNTVNIENSVKAIEERENRISELQKLQEKYADNPKMLALMTRALGVELSKRDIDKTRATYESSYQNKARAIENTYKDFGVESFEELEQLAGLISKNGAMQYKSYGNGGVFGQLFSKYTRERMNDFAESHNINLDELYNMPRDEFNTLSEAIRDAVEVIREAKQVTAEEVKYHLESNAINAQQLAFDQENKRAEQTKSLNSQFQQLLELYKGSEEYKQKEEEERTKTLTEAKKILEQLIPRADSAGNLSFNQFSMPEFLKYDAQGAFVAGKKFDIVNGNRPVNEESMKQLREQVSYAMGEAQKQSYFYGDNRTAVALKNEIETLNKNLNDEDYLNQFSKTLDNVKSILDSSRLSDSVKKQIYGYVVSSSLSHELTVGGENANPDDLHKGAKYDFIPLWKRILAQYTGLSTNGMVSTADTLKNYRDDMAIRNMTAGVLSASMRTEGTDRMMKLIAYNDKTKLKDDSAETLQVDWKTTKDNLKAFALQIRSTTTVIEAYKKGLEDELSVYENLITAGITQGESQDANQQKWISTKQIAKMKLSNAQLVNAFGDTVETESGKSYNVKDIRFDEQGRMFDNMGNEITEQVKVTSNLSKFIENELPKLRMELANTSVQEQLIKSIAKLEQERDAEQAKIFGQSSYVIGALKNNKVTGAEDLSSKSYSSKASIEAGKIINQEITSLFETIVGMELKSGKTDITKLNNKIQDLVKDEDLDKQRQKLNAITNLQTKLKTGDYDNAQKAFEEFIVQFPESIEAIVEQAKKSAKAMENNELTELADSLLRNSPLSISAAMLSDRQRTGNDIFEQSVMESLGAPRVRFEKFNEKVTASALANPSENSLLVDNYKKEFSKSLSKAGVDENEITAYSEKISELIDSGKLDELKKYLEDIKQASTWEAATQSVNKWAISLGQVGATLNNISNNTKKVLQSFASDTITSSMETWGECLQKGDDASQGLAQNMLQMTANMTKNLGSMITQAGLALAISSIGNKVGVLAGLAIAAAGGGLSFVGGYLSAAASGDNSSKESKEYEKLLKIKQDLTELLRQAREDSIYYENTTRHKKAISANDAFTTKSVHDAIITPRGDVVTTDPKDYLIATKTPRTLVGGGAPTINFSVVDKSTGIKVTQQKSSYNEETNSIDFEAVIESKISEVIASSKGDDAFAAREARLRGRSVIA